MASAKDLRKRITSVKNTQQITRAMKMVSAAKLRRAQDAIVNLRPYAKQLAKIVQNIATLETSLEGFPLLNSSDKQETGNLLLIVVTSDRGLCGGFNSNVIKAAQRFLKTNGGKYSRCDLGFIGKKGFEFFKHRSVSKGKYYQNFFQETSFSKSKVLSEELMGAFLSGEYNEIKFAYNEFHSAISQQVVMENLLPVKFEASDNASDAATESANQDTIYEPSHEEILTKLLPQYFMLQVHKVILESVASEHGARMAAMENATKNAGEMIHELNLEYNKTRQASITKELLEIISGSEAQKA